MKPVDFDNTRRHLQIMLRGQELTASQVRELAEIIGQRANPVMAVGYLDEFGPMPEGIAASFIETTGIEPLQKRANRIEFERVIALANLKKASHSTPRL